MRRGRISKPKWFSRRAAPGRPLEDVLGKRWESATSLGTAIEDGLLWGLRPCGGISECVWVGVLVLRLHLSCVVSGGGVGVGSHAVAPAVAFRRGCLICHGKLCPLGCQILLPTRFLKADSHPPHHHIHPRRHQASFIPASGQRTPYFPSQLQISCLPLRSPTTPT